METCLDKNVEAALKQGYVYFICWEDDEIHKGFIVQYLPPLSSLGEKFELAYGVHYYFKLRGDLCRYDCYDCEDLIRDPTKQGFYTKHNYGLTTQGVYCNRYGKAWALTKEELERSKDHGNLSSCE